MDWLDHARARIWEEVSFAANYHVRGKLPRLVSGYESARALLRRRPSCCRVTTPAEDPGQQLRLLLGGDDERVRRYLTHRAGRVGSPPSVAARPRGEGADLEILEVPRIVARLYSRRGYFVLPWWVSQSVELSRLERFIAASRHTSQRVRRILRRGYDYEVVRDRASFDEFYHRMYLPTMTARHGEEAYLRGPLYLWRGLEHGALLMVRRDGRRVAGILNVRSARDAHVMSTWAGGMLDGDLALVEEDADSACIYFTLMWARGLPTCTQVSLTATRPFLDDGLFRYRKRWGAHVEAENAWAEKVLVLRVNRLTDGVRRFLQRNPFIVVGRGGLEGFAYWSDGAAEQLSDLHSPGLARLTILADRDRRPPLRGDETALIRELDPHAAADELRALAVALSS